MEIIQKYFPALSEVQQVQFAQLLPLYTEWNTRINVISRKDIEHLYLHHVLHSLAIAKFVEFKPGASVMELGAGGGFPGIPLAILFPETRFLLVDSVGKKLKVAEDIATQIGLTNVGVQWARAEELKEEFDFVVTRAVASVELLARWAMPRLKSVHIHTIPNGIIALKGLPYREEVKALRRGDYYEAIPVLRYFKEDYFEEKYLLYIQSRK